MKQLARMVDRRPRPKILMYHRVCDLPCDPWGIAVHPTRFAEQLDILVRHRTPVDLQEFVTRLRHGSLPADAVAVTFDDGYVDTLQHARPALAAAGVPATLFLATGFIGTPLGWWWDELAALLLQRADPAVIRFRCPGLDELCLGPPEASDFNPAWRAWTEPRTLRQHAFVAMYGHLKELSPDSVAATMAMLRSVLGHDGSLANDRGMTEDEVRTLIDDGLITLGGHTVRHPNLPVLAADQQRDEVSNGKVATERLAGKPITGFAYPFGATSDRSRMTVRECGFDWACTTDAGAPMHRSSDHFALPRSMVLDMEGPAFRHALMA